MPFRRYNLISFGFTQGGGNGRSLEVGPATIFARWLAGLLGRVALEGSGFCRSTVLFIGGGHLLLLHRVRGFRVWIHFTHLIFNRLIAVDHGTVLSLIFCLALFVGIIICAGVDGVIEYCR